MSYTLEIPMAGVPPVGASRRTLRVILIRRGSGKVRARLALLIGPALFSFGQTRWMEEREWHYVLEPELSAMARAANLGFAVTRQGE